MQVTRVVGVIGVLLLAGGTPRAMSMQQPPAPAPTATATDLTGEWKLNNELTQRPERPEDSPRRRTGGQAPGGMGGFGGRRGPGGIGGGGFGGGGGGGRSGDPEAMAKTREAMRLATLIPDRLTIVRGDGGFIVTDGGGFSQKFVPDGKTNKTESGALKVETKVKWDEAVLVVERKFDGGVKVTDRYWVTETPRQLVIASRIENKNMGGDHARALQRVYDGSQVPVLSGSQVVRMP